MSIPTFFHLAPSPLYGTYYHALLGRQYIPVKVTTYIPCTPLKE